MPLYMYLKYFISACPVIEECRIQFCPKGNSFIDDTGELTDLLTAWVLWESVFGSQYTNFDRTGHTNQHESVNQQKPLMGKKEVDGQMGLNDLLLLLLTF